MLVIASKVKEYVKDTHDLRTGKDYLTKLSEAVQRLIDESVDNARKDKRGTLKERDLPDYVA